MVADTVGDNPSLDLGAKMHTTYMEIPFTTSVMMVTDLQILSFAKQTGLLPALSSFTQA